MCMCAVIKSTKRWRWIDWILFDLKRDLVIFYKAQLEWANMCVCVWVCVAHIRISGAPRSHTHSEWIISAIREESEAAQLALLALLLSDSVAVLIVLCTILNVWSKNCIKRRKSSTKNNCFPMSGYQCFIQVHETYLQTFTDICSTPK